MANQDPQHETNMEAFYASLESVTIIPSHAKLSEETKKAIQILQDLMSKDFSLLLHPGRSTAMKDTLKYLLNLPPQEGFSIITKSEIQRLLLHFTRLTSEYSYMYSEDLSSKSAKVRNELDANVKEFLEMEKEDKCLLNQLESLEEEKRKLEEKINAVKIQIENSTTQRDKVVERKMGLFDEASVLKAKRDELLKAELECANIEVEWFYFRDQFIRRTCFEDWN